LCWPNAARLGIGQSFRHLVAPVLANAAWLASGGAESLKHPCFRRVDSSATSTRARYSSYSLRTDTRGSARSTIRPPRSDTRGCWCVWGRGVRRKLVWVRMRGQSGLTPRNNIRLNSTCALLWAAKRKARFVGVKQRWAAARHSNHSTPGLGDSIAGRFFEKQPVFARRDVSCGTAHLRTTLGRGGSAERVALGWLESCPIPVYARVALAICESPLRRGVHIQDRVSGDGSAMGLA